MDERMEEFLNQLPPELREQAQEIAEKANAFGNLLSKVKASAIPGIDLANPAQGLTYMVTTCKELNDETQAEFQKLCPFPLRFNVGLKPETIEFINKIGQQIPVKLLTHKEIPTSFMVEVLLPEEVPEEVRDAILTKLIPIVNGLLEGDGFPKQWGITLNGNTVFETKAAVSEDDVEDLKAKLEKAQTIDDILNSI